ncbi:MAG: hypothetical protein ACE5OZ_07430 [Candidatus Heimdallarchaeota archaeon]
MFDTIVLPSPHLVQFCKTEVIQALLDTHRLATNRPTMLKNNPTTDLLTQRSQIMSLVNRDVRFLREKGVEVSSEIFGALIRKHTAKVKAECAAAIKEGRLKPVPVEKALEILQESE